MAIERERMTKQDILKSLASSLPEDASIEDFHEHLVLLNAVAEGLADLQEGRVISHDDMVERVKQWLG